MQDKFFSNIQSTWQSVELPHQDLLKKARRNLILHWCSLIYSLMFIIGSIASGIWLGINSQNDVLYWIGAFTAIFLMPALAAYLIKLRWFYGNWYDKSAMGTLNTLIKHAKMNIQFTQIMRPLAVSYLFVPVICLGAHHLNLTRLSYDFIFGFSLGILISSGLLLFWMRCKLPRLNKELEKLISMKKEWESLHD